MGRHTDLKPAPLEAATRFAQTDARPRLIKMSDAGLLPRPAWRARLRVANFQGDPLNPPRRIRKARAKLARYL